MTGKGLHIVLCDHGEQEVGDEDPLDAFMAAEVAPEVKAKEVAEGAKREAERQRLAAEIAVSPWCCPPAKLAGPFTHCREIMLGKHSMHPSLHLLFIKWAPCASAHDS